MKYYHATSATNAWSIIDGGEIKTGFDGIVYLADSLENALRFVAVRTMCMSGCEPIIIFEIDIPKDKQKLVEETFDHNYNFFKCKSYGYPKNVPTSWITDIRQWLPKK